MLNIPILYARHSPDEETIKITVSADKHTMLRFKRFLFMIQHASNVGHSGLFAMSVDGDGSEYVRIDGIDFKNLPDLRDGYDKYGGQDVEIALEDGYTFKNLKR